jgi:hypothetical protein
MTVSPLAIVPVLTNVGIAALIRAQCDGLQGALSHMAIGRGVPNGSGGWKGYSPDRTMTALRNEDARVPLFSGTPIEAGFRVLARFPETPAGVELPVREVAFVLSTGEPLAIWSADELVPLTYRTERAGVDLAFELHLAQIPLSLLSLTVLNPDIPDTTGILARMIAVEARGFLGDIRDDWSFLRAGA